MKPHELDSLTRRLLGDQPRGLHGCQYFVGLGGVYAATLKGERIAVERFSSPDQQTTALAACKSACAKHAEGK